MIYSDDVINIEYKISQSPLRLNSSKTISCPLLILVSIYSDNFSSPALTSLTPSTTNFFKTGIRFNNEISYGSPTHVEMAIPFLGCSLKLDAILSTIMVRDKSLPS